MPETKALSTGQAAKYCHVSQPTIINWIKRGNLRAYTTPGGHYRILLRDFLSFLERHEMPVDSTLKASSRPRVVIVSDVADAEALAEIIHSGRFEVTLITNDYEAAAQIARLKPSVIVLDMRSATLDCPALHRWLRASANGSPPRVLAIVHPGDEAIAGEAGDGARLSGASTVSTLRVELGILRAPQQEDGAT